MHTTFSVREISQQLSDTIHSPNEISPPHSDISFVRSVFTDLISVFLSDNKEEFLHERLYTCKFPVV